MKKGDLDFKILKEIGKLSEIEFLGVLRFLNIMVVEKTASPIDSAQSEETAPGSTEVDLIDKKQKLDIQSFSPRPFPELIEDLGERLHSLNRKQKRNLYHLIREVTKKRDFKGNQNFLISEKED